MTNEQRLSTLIDLVIRASWQGAGRYLFTARHPAESCEIRALQPDADGIVALLNRALDEMEQADAIAEDRYQRYKRYEYAQRVSRTVERLEELRQPTKIAEIQVARLNTPIRREMITSYHIFPRGDR